MRLIQFGPLLVVESRLDRAYQQVEKGRMCAYAMVSPMDALPVLATNALIADLLQGSSEQGKISRAGYRY